MALGDGIRRDIAAVSPAERDRGARADYIGDQAGGALTGPAWANDPEQQAGGALLRLPVALCRRLRPHD
jgi:hypothetical protein